jgi:hypothetical protein
MGKVLTMESGKTCTVSVMTTLRSTEKFCEMTRKTLSIINPITPIIPHDIPKKVDVSPILAAASGASS